MAELRSAGKHILIDGRTKTTKMVTFIFAAPLNPNLKVGENERLRFQAVPRSRYDRLSIWQYQ